MVNCIVVDDDRDILNLLCDFLDVFKIEVLAKGSNGKEAVELYEKHNPDIVFTDLAMPNYDGLYAVENIKDKDQNAKIIVITANSNDYETHLFEMLNIPVISKPFGVDVLSQAIADISETENHVPASFKIKYKFKDEYDYYSCKVNYAQYRNFKKLSTIQECEIIKTYDDDIELEQEMQKALNLAVQNDTSHIRKLSEITV